MTTPEPLDQLRRENFVRRLKLASYLLNSACSDFATCNDAEGERHLSQAMAWLRAPAPGCETLAPIEVREAELRETAGRG